ncbi:MAG: Hpt domain-containing protein [Clostridia bacterium]|nr:Hpt domain-containing protein [Clostridia bacterium]
MTLRELYDGIGGSYDQAISVLRIEKLIDKHIRKVPENAVFAALSAAGETLDGTAVFESAHAIKGVCLNLGLVNIAAVASELSEEFRPGKERRMTDREVREKIAEIEKMRKRAAELIAVYSAQ